MTKIHKIREDDDVPFSPRRSTFYFTVTIDGCVLLRQLRDNSVFYNCIISVLTDMDINLNNLVLFIMHMDRDAQASSDAVCSLDHNRSH